MIKVGDLVKLRRCSPWATIPVGAVGLVEIFRDSHPDVYEFTIRWFAVENVNEGERLSYIFSKHGGDIIGSIAKTFHVIVGVEELKND